MLHQISRTEFKQAIENGIAAANEGHGEPFTDAELDALRQVGLKADSSVVGVDYVGGHKCPLAFVGLWDSDTADWKTCRAFYRAFDDSFEFNCATIVAVVG